jgi:Cu(I)/Ag(I) efflux system protein CusF
MRRLVFALMSLIALSGAAGFYRAAAQQALVDGQVTKIDEAAGKITIRHGPFKKFDMEDPMTMVYPVQNPALLKSVKSGDKVKFDADRINGQITVTTIQKAK